MILVKYIILIFLLLSVYESVSWPLSTKLSWTPCSNSIDTRPTSSWPTSTGPRLCSTTGYRKRNDSELCVVSRVCVCVCVQRDVELIFFVVEFQSGSVATMLETPNLRIWKQLRNSK